MTDNIKVPENVKFTPRCPLCFAAFRREVIPSRQTHLEHLLKEAQVNYWGHRVADNKEAMKEAKEWGELVEASIKAGGAEAFFCDFCKIACACNDPFINKWDEVYTVKEPCPKCGTEMRFFCTATTYTQLKCPLKTCGVKIESVEPDRKPGDVELRDSKGDLIALPGISRPTATPQLPAAAQLGPAPDDPDLPKEAEIKLPPLQ